MKFYSLLYHTLRDRNEAAPDGDPPGCGTIGYKTSKVHFHPLAAELDEIVPKSVIVIVIRHHFLSVRASLPQHPPPAGTFGDGDN